MSTFASRICNINAIASASRPGVKCIYNGTQTFGTPKWHSNMAFVFGSITLLCHQHQYLVLSTMKPVGVSAFIVCRHVKCLDP